MSKCIIAGSSNNFALGPNHEDTTPSDLILPQNLSIKFVALGPKHGHIVDSNNSLFSWGRGSKYRLGTGDQKDLKVPTLVNATNQNFEISMIVAGKSFGAVLGVNGLIVVWGGSFWSVPDYLICHKRITYISCGGNSILAAAYDGSVILFDRPLERENIKIPNERVVITACGTAHYLVLTDTGNVYGWGKKNACGFPEDVKTPTLIVKLANRVNAIYASYDNSWFIDKDGMIYRCGNNNKGCLGNENSEVIKMPKRLRFPKGLKVKQIACGKNFTLILTSEGSAFAAGSCQNGKTAIHKSNYNNNKTFQKCELGINSNLTQVACSKLNSAFVVNGIFDPETFHLSLSYKTFPINSLPSYYILKGYETKLLDPNSPFLQRCGLKANDIVRNENGELAKILGATKEGLIFMVKENMTFESISSTNVDAILFNLQLIERSGHNLLSIPFEQERIVQIDISPKELFNIGGVKYGDVLLDKSTIIGTRGQRLYCMTGESIIKEINPTNLTVIKREKKSVAMVDFVDSITRVVEINDADDSLRIDNVYGTGIYIGKSYIYFCYFFTQDFGLARYLDHLCPIVRSSNKYIEAYTIDNKQIELSIYRYKSLFTFDFVTTPKGYGCISGFYRNGENVEVAVLLENNSGYRGLVTLFPSESVIPLARLFAPLIIDSMSANSYDFYHFKILPGDEIEIDQNIYMIRGTKNNKVYGELLSKTSNNIYELDYKNGRVIKRHLYAGILIDKEGNKIGYSSQFSSYQQFLNAQQRTKEGLILELYDHSSYTQKDNHNNIFIKNFNLPKIH